jgi:hypothetical protein
MRISAARTFTRTPKRLAAAAVTVVALMGGSVAVAGSAWGHDSVPKSAAQIPNLGQIETQIEAYYGDTVVSGEHNASPTSNYANEVTGIEAKAEKDLSGNHGKSAHHAKGKPAIVLDVDDTTLLTYNYETEQGFGYDVASNTAYIDAEKMSAVFGMPAFESWAVSKGFTVFFITGRPESQRMPTIGNLQNVGYTVTSANLFMKNSATPPAYLSCGTTCTTDQYKAGTRAYIESQGYDIRADLGDQYSDLSGGFADNTYKLPNPMYFIP